jgi:hypothetical protein
MPINPAGLARPMDCQKPLQSAVERNWSGSSFHGNDDPLHLYLYLFVLAQFRTEIRFTLFLELL